MPTYQFTCIECDDTIDHFFPITQKDHTLLCEKCGNKRNKVLGVGAVNFKGSGWGHQA
jgi:putative FmdB family regulatory protein